MARKHIITIRLLAVFVALCSAFLPLELGGGITLQSKESWEYGIAPIMTFNALLLFAISFYFEERYTWVRWVFVLWLPLNFLSIILVSWKVRPTPLSEIIIIGVPIVVIWFCYSYKLFWSKSSNETVA